MPQRCSLAVLTALALAMMPACQQRMASQPSYRPDQVSGFFEDGRAARPFLPETVARGHLRTDTELYTGSTVAGKEAAIASAALLGNAAGDPHGLLAITLAVEHLQPVATFPFPITEKVLNHGMHRYMIYCVVCHDTLGTGEGIVVQRGYTKPPSYHINRLRDVPVGHFFQVITLGYGSMPSYAAQIPPRDRWAIAAYIRALQLSQHFPERELTADMRQAWDKQTSLVKGDAR